MSSGAASASGDRVRALRGCARAGSRSDAPRPWLRRGSGWRPGSPDTTSSAASKSPASSCWRACASSGSTSSGSSESAAPLELSGCRRQQRVEPAAQLLGRLHALEAGQRLPGSQCHHGRDRLDAEYLRHPGRHVDVDRRQRPLAVVGGGQAGQRVGQLHAGVAARRPQQHHHRHLVGPDQHFVFEVGLGDLDVRHAGRPTPSARGVAAGRPLGALLEAGQIDRPGQGGPDRRSRTGHAVKSVMRRRLRDPPGCGGAMCSVTRPSKSLARRP